MNVNFNMATTLNNIIENPSEKLTKKDITTLAESVKNIGNISSDNQKVLVKTINKLGGLASIKRELVNKLERHNSNMKGKKTEFINAFVIGADKIVEKDNINKAAIIAMKVELDKKIEPRNYINGKKAAPITESLNAFKIKEGKRIEEYNKSFDVALASKLEKKVEPRNSMNGKKTESLNTVETRADKIVGKDNKAYLVSEIEKKLVRLIEQRDEVDGYLNKYRSNSYRKGVREVADNARTYFEPTISSEVNELYRPKFRMLEKKLLDLCKGSKQSDTQTHDILHSVTAQKSYPTKDMFGHIVHKSALSIHTSPEKLKEYGMANKVEDFGRRQYVQITKIVPNEVGVKFTSALQELDQLVSKRDAEYSSKMKDVLYENHVLSMDQYWVNLKKISHAKDDLNHDITISEKELMKMKK